MTSTNTNSRIETIMKTGDVQLLHKLHPKIHKDIFQRCEKILEKSKHEPTINVAMAKKILDEGNCINRSKSKLKPYQKEAIRKLNSVENGGILLYFDTGTGKTLTALSMSQCYLDEYPDHDVIVICPTKVKENFENELLKYGSEKWHNYHFFSYAKFYMADKIGEISPDSYEKPLLIVDEVHNLRNCRGKQFETVMKYASIAKKKVLLSATPLVNSPVDIAAIINIIRGAYDIGVAKYPRKIDVDKGAEIDNHRHLHVMKRPRGSCVEKYMSCCKKELEQVMQYVKPFTVVVKKDVTDGNYPSYTIHDKMLRMSPEYYKKFFKILEKKQEDHQSFSSLFNASDVDLNSFYNGNRRLTNKVQKEYYSEKLKFILQKVNLKTQTLIYTNWDDFGVQVLKELLSEYFDKNPLLPPFAVISGKTTKKDTNKNIINYNTSKISTLVITKAGSEGLDLKGTRIVIILDPVWNPSGMEQIIGRAVRFKSHTHLPPVEQHVDIYQLMLVEPDLPESDFDQSISGDVILYQIIQKKKSMIETFKELITN